MKITLEKYEIVDILSIETDGTHLVFDIEVDSEEHAFYAVSPDGAMGVSHNSAMISLSDLEDKEMALSKHGEWWTFNQQRALANNSAVWNRPLTKDQFFQEWEMLKASGSGERGIFSRYGSIKNSKNRELDANCGTNPCVVGDTLIAVADGRGYVKISELAKEGKDVDVYTVKDGNLVVRKMRNPRITGYNSPVVKVEFTNGSWIKVTPNHKLVLINGHKIEVGDLKETDEIESLYVMKDQKGFMLSYSKSFVKSVEYIQSEDVYNGTVEDTHTYFAIGESVDDKMLFVLNKNCGEIILRPYQTCNLSEVIIRPTDTKEDIRKKVEIATIIGTFQSCFDNFPYVNLEWERSQREDRLLGVSLTGIMQNGNTINPDVDFLEHLNKSAAIVNAEYADKLGIKRSAAITCIKPSGTVSQLCGTSSGIHPVYANRYIRRIRMDKKDPLTNFLVEQGLEFEEDVFNKENLIFPFYKEEEGVNRNDITAIGQLELYLKYKKHYTDHNVSNTIYVGDGEWVNVGNWVYNNQTEINGLSFLPRDNHTYVQAPYTEVSERSFVNNKEVDFSDFYEFEDLTTASQEYACAGGACEIK